MMFSAIVLCRNRLNDWNTMPIFRRTSVRSVFGSQTSTPSTRMEPAVGVSSLLMQRRNVDFTVPEGLMMLMIYVVSKRSLYTYKENAVPIVSEILLNDDFCLTAANADLDFIRELGNNGFFKLVTFFTCLRIILNIAAVICQRPTIIDSSG